MDFIDSEVLSGDIPWNLGLKYMVGTSNKSVPVAWPLMLCSTQIDQIGDAGNCATMSQITSMPKVMSG